MIFNKKRVFLYSSILLLILIGVYFATIVDSLGFVTRSQLNTNVTTSTNTIVSSVRAGGGNGINYTELINWKKGGVAETIQFTLNFTGAVGRNSTAEINVSVPSGYTLNFSSLNLNICVGNVCSNSTAPIADQAANWTSNATASVISFKPSVGNLSVGAKFAFNFSVVANNNTEGVVNWTITIRDNTTLVGSGAGNTDSGFGILTGIDGLAPRLNSTLGHNVSDGINTKTTLSSTQYLQSNPTSDGQGVNITVAFNDYNIDRVLLVYNSTGGTLNFTLIRNSLHQVNFTRGQAFNLSDENVTFNVEEATNCGGVRCAKANLTSLDTRGALDSDFPPAYIFSFNISNGTWSNNATSDGQQFKYVFVVHDLFNNSEIINNSNAEFTIVRDVNNPTVTLTAPTDTTIDVYGSIKYTCDGSDTSSLASCTTTLTKPSGDTIVKTGCGTEHTFITTDTNGAGTNTVKCEVKDNVGRTASTSKTFTISSATGTGGAGGGGGGGGGSAGSSADNPITVTEAGTSVDAGTLSTTETYTSLVKEGTVTFTVAGGSHSAKVLDVTEDSVTIEVSSDPQTLTLTTGETKEVDLTADGTNDLAITLRAITDGKADLVFKSLEVAAPPAEGEAPGVVTGEEAGPSYTWLWVALVVVVVLVLLWLGRKKR